MGNNLNIKTKITALFLLIATAALCFSGCSVAERTPEKLIEKLMEAYVPTVRDVFDERSDIIERRHQLMDGGYYIDAAEDETKFSEENISKATAELIEDFLVYNRYRGYFSKVKGINSTNYANIKYLQHHALNELEKRADAPTALVQTLCSLSDEYFEYKEGKLSLSGEYGNEVYDYTMVTLSYIIGSEFYRDKLSADEATVYEYICKKAGIEPYKTYSFIDDDKVKKYDHDALAAKITEAYTPTGRDIFRERCDMVELRRKMAEENGGDYFAAAAETRFPEDKLDADTQNLIIDFLIYNRYEGVLDNDSGLSDKIYINCIGKHQRYVLEELETREDALDMLLHTFVDLSDEYFKYLSGEYSLSEKYDEEVFKYTMDTLTYIIGSEFYKVNLTDEEAALYEYICEKANLIPYKVYPCSYFDEMVLPDNNNSISELPITSHDLQLCAILPSDAEPNVTPSRYIDYQTYDGTAIRLAAVFDASHDLKRQLFEEASSIPGVILAESSWDEINDDYNCHSYAWLLDADYRYHYYTDTDYAMRFLQDDFVVQISRSQVQTGDRAVYFQDGWLAHSAIVQAVSGDRIFCKSKWGQGCLVLHNETSVIDDYKNTDGTYDIRYYRIHNPHNYISYTENGATTHIAHCNECGKDVVMSHDFTAYSTTEFIHSRECTVCGYVQVGAHIFPSGGMVKMCSVCRYGPNSGSILSASAEYK